MGGSGRTLRSALALIVMLGAGAFVPAMSQQQTPATKVTTLLKEAIAELPGREIIMVTLDIPPGGGSPPHRHPGHHIFGYVGDVQAQARSGRRNHLDQGPDLPRGAGPVARRFSQCKPDRARQGSRRHRGRERQAGHRAGEAVASAATSYHSVDMLSFRLKAREAARSPPRGSSGQWQR
jgi:hypothetical protein